MKKFVAIALAVVSAATPAMAKPWAYDGEPLRWHWDISTKKKGVHWLVVHSTNARKVAPGKLRVEISLRTNGGKQITYNPEVVYDELTRCDGNKVCNPPVYPLVSYRQPLQKHVAPKWWTHSMTIDCRNGARVDFKTADKRFQFNAVPICNHFRVG